MWCVERWPNLYSTWNGSSMLMGPRDFAWSLVHIVQIGLGRFDTFMDCGVPWMQTLLEASSRQSFPSLRGIGVDPVEEAVVGFSAAAARHEAPS